MTTLVIQIGNSDDKLPQAEWAKYARRTHETINAWAEEIHFSGGSYTFDPWQNACFVCEVDDDCHERLHAALIVIARRFQQDSIAITKGETVFISPSSEVKNER